ncbi:hypothetical protein BC834DRAFT_282018 [Gloeopeniophorella convolvens]|nr:hypothetical protein BC834DRAFT_282018 [Gloeopeniophorella convolvens]
MGGKMLQEEAEAGACAGSPRATSRSSTPSSALSENVVRPRVTPTSASQPLTNATSTHEQPRWKPEPSPSSISSPIQADRWTQGHTSNTTGPQALIFKPGTPGASTEGRSPSLPDMRRLDLRGTTTPTPPGAAADGSPQPRPESNTTIENGGRMAPPSGDPQSAFSRYARPSHPRESSATLARAPTRPFVQPIPSSSKLTLTHNNSIPIPIKEEPEPMDVDPPIIEPPKLDLRALSNARPRKHAKQTFQRMTVQQRPRTPSPPPAPPPVPAHPVKYEDPEIGSLDAPPMGVLAPRLPPRVLPELAAEDPRILEMIERQEQREASRQRRGTRKPHAMRAAGKARSGFVLVSARPDTESARAWEAQAEHAEPGGVFAAYFSRRVR